LVQTFVLGHERSEEKSFRSLGTDGLRVFAEIDQTVGQRILFGFSIDDDQGGVFLIPFAGDAIALMLVRMVALNEGDCCRLVFFDDGGRDFQPTIVGKGR